jgi:hypothetical protein
MLNKQVEKTLSLVVKMQKNKEERRKEKNQAEEPLFFWRI